MLWVENSDAQHRPDGRGGDPVHALLFGQSGVLAVPRRAADRALPDARGGPSRVVPEGHHRASRFGGHHRANAQGPELRHHVRRQVAPRAPAAVPAHEPRLRRVLRHPLQQRHVAAAAPAQHRNAGGAGETGNADAALHRTGAALHRTIQGITLLPLPGAHLPAHSARRFGPLSRQVAAGPVRGRHPRNWTGAPARF